MEDKKLLEVIDIYKRDFQTDGILEIKYPYNQFFNDSNSVLAHCHSMLRGIMEFIAIGGKEKRDRALIRLGFVQGCLVATRQYTVEDLKNHNKPDPSKPKTLEPLTKEELEDWEY